MGLLSRKVIPFAQTLELLVTEAKEMIFALLVPHWIGYRHKKRGILLLVFWGTKSYTPDIR